MDKRAVSNVVSAVILTGAAIALCLVVFAWAQTRSLDFMKGYGEATDAEMARLKERLAVEYVFYNSSSGNVHLYLLNWGAIDKVKIQNVHFGNGTWHQAFPNPNLKFLNDTLIQDLDRGEEGYVVLPLNPNPLTEDIYYYVRIVTERGSLFASGFVA